MGPGGVAHRVLVLRSGRWCALAGADRGAGLVLADGASTSACGRRRRPGGVKATLADRDRIDTDDQVLFFLSTFNDSRQAFVFGVNPLGVQADGALVEGASRAVAAASRASRRAASRRTSAPTSSSSRAAASPTRASRSRSASRSRACATSPRDTQDWGLHVAARDAGRGARGQLGAGAAGRRLVPGAVRARCAGLTRPASAASCSTSTPSSPPAPTGRRGRRDGSWQYDAARPRPGVNVRWGVTANLTLNGTVNPDFSQVESDAGQFQFDPRQAVFFPEKRPFFLDGIEQFATPNNLIYTRRIVAPDVAAKLTGQGRRVHERRRCCRRWTTMRCRATGEDQPVFTIAARAAGHRRAVEARRRLHRSRRRRRTATRWRASTRASCSATSTRCRPRARVSRTEDGQATAVAPLWQVHGDAQRAAGTASATSMRGIDAGLPGGARASSAGRASPRCALTNQAHRSTGGRAPAREASRATSVARRHVAVRRLRRRARRAGSQAALQQQRHAARRVGGRRVGARRDVRLRRGPLRGLRAARHDRRRRRSCGRSSARRRCRTSTSSCRSSTPQRRGRRGRWRSCCGARTRTSTSGRRRTSCSATSGVLWRPTERLRVDGRYQLADLPAANGRVLRRARRLHPAR